MQSQSQTNMKRLDSSTMLSKKVLQLLSINAVHFTLTVRPGLKYLDARGGHLFDPQTAVYQFAPGLGYQAKVRDAGGSIVVTDLPTALEALKTIVIQGEGSPGPFDDPAKLEKDHYDVFLDLKNGVTTWDVYPVVENPVTSDYWRLDPRIYQVSPIHYLTLIRWITDENLSRFHSLSTQPTASSCGRLRPSGMSNRTTVDTSLFLETCTGS